MLRSLGRRDPLPPQELRDRLLGAVAETIIFKNSRYVARGFFSWALEAAKHVIMDG
jgi:hypothetical protein